jgi:hypothetical protein
MAIQKITGDVIATSAVTADSLADTTITAAKLHTTLDLTGKTVTVATASAGDNDTTVASTAFVSTAVANLADSAPSTLDTLNELAAALGDDANFSTTVTTSIATKLPLAGGTMTGNIAHASDFTLDVGGDINLDADGGDINLKDGGTAMGRLGLENGDLNIASSQQDYDIRLKGNDGGSVITALHLDMSAAGAATFNSSISSGVINAFGASGGSNLSYASNFKADSSNIQITLERGTDATGWGGIGASGSNAFMVYNESTQKKLILTQAGNLGIGTDNIGSAGLSLSNSMNFNISEGANSSFVNIFRQASSAATVVANGYKYTDTANKVASSYASSWAKSAIALNYGNTIFYNDTAATTAVGTDVTPTESMRIDSSGRLGLGTSSPTYSLDVSSSSVLTGRIQSSSGETILELDNTNTNGRRFMIISGGNSGSLAGGKFGVYDATAGATRLAIDSSGNLGIGTDNPDGQLHVRTTDTTGAIRLGGGNGANNHRIFISAHSTAAYIDSYGGGAYNSLGIQASVLHLNSSSGTGNVGIGTASPQTKLHVFKGESSAPAPLADSTLVLENSTHNYLQFLGPNDTQQAIIFGDSDDDNVASVAYNHNTDDLDITALDNVNIVADILNYSNSAGDGYFHMSGSSSRYADQGFWVADNYQLEVGNAHIYLKTQTSAKDIILGTHNTERMRISGSGHHIGIGTGNHFVIAEDGAGTYLGKDNNSSLRFITANATRLQINNTGTTILTSGATNLGVLQLSSSVATYQLKGGDNLGYMGYFTGGYHRWFGSDGSEDMRLTSTGLVVNNANNYQGIHAKGSNAPCFTLGKNSSSTPEWRMGITGYDGDDFAISTGTSTNDRFRMDPSGNTIIGSANNFTPIAMHDTVATFSARGPIASGYSMGAASAGPRNTRDWFVYSSHTNVGSSVYIHMKTNLWAGGGGAGNTEYTMSCFTYKDYYAYGGDTSPGGYVGWHNWSGSLFNGHLVNNGTLALVQSSYVSSDGYVVLVAKLGASYAQFSIDWCQWAGYPFRERRVTAVTNTASATGAY